MVSNQDFHSAQVNASVDTLWALLQLEMEDPQRFDEEIATFEIVEKHEAGLARKISRQSQSWNEQIKLTGEALLVEHVRTFEDGTVMTLIHQLAPANGACDLNLASTWEPSEDSVIIAASLQPLVRRAKMIKDLAEAIEQ